MFEYQPRRHPLQTFQFWFFVLVCFSGVVAWRYGEFQTQHPDESIVTDEAEFEDELPPPPLLDDLVLGKGEELISLPAPPPQMEEDSSGLSMVRSSHHLEIATPPSGQNESSDLSAVTPPPFPGSVTNEQSVQTELVEAETEIQQLSLNQPDEAQDVRTASLPEQSISRSLDSPELKPTGFNVRSIDDLISQGEDVLALRELSKVYWESPELRGQIRSRINSLSRRVYFQVQPHYMPPYEVQFGDRLETIAKQYQVPWQYLAKLNRTNPQRLQAGKKLKVIQGPFSVVVDLSDFELTVHAHGYYVVRMPVGIGKDNSTPIGTFRVTDKVADPIYYGPDGVIKNDDPSNPLGEHWIAISDENDTLQGYGLHGTIDPNSIGKCESRGCVRLHDQDIADLFDLLSIGSEVVIRR